MVGGRRHQDIRVLPVSRNVSRAGIRAATAGTLGLRCLFACLLACGRRCGQDATGGSRLTSGAHAKGFFHEPTIFTDVAPGMRIAREEIFGPVVSVIPCDSLEQAIDSCEKVAHVLEGIALKRRD